MTDIDHRSRRERSLLLAVGTSILSKGGNAVIQFVAMPVAYQVLGNERFGIFGMLQAIMFFMYLSDFGVAGGMGRRLTGAIAMGKREEQTKIISSGFFVILGFCLVISLLGAVLLLTVPITSIFGEKFVTVEGELLANLWLCLGLFLALTIASILLRVRDCCQEMHITNTFGAVANILMAVSLIIGMRAVPEVWFLIVTLYGIQVLAYSINVAAAFRKRPWLRPRLSAVERPMIQDMLREGMAFFIVLSMAPVFEREGLRLALGHFEGPKAVGDFSVLLNLGLLLYGFVTMVTFPMTPAIMEACARNDLPWIRATYRRLLRLFALGSVLALVGFVTLGPWFVDFWMRKDMPFGRMEMLLFAFYFIVTMWTHVHAMMASSCGLAGNIWKIYLIECSSTLGGAWLGASQWGLHGALLGATSGMLLVTFWLIPAKVLRFLAKSPAPEETAPPLGASALAEN